MKVPEQAERNIRANLPGETIAMGISEAAMNHIMDTLAGLYTNRPQALVREYSTNAWDAHVEAGITRPIEVTLPSRMTPFLTVRDHGVGLTVEDIHAIYSQYGESSKRGTNAQNGMLGFGCKSALSYCDQFTVTSVKDSVRITVMVGRDEEGSGKMVVVDTSTVNEANGTVVQIPVAQQDVTAFRVEAERLYRWWPAGTVLADGKPPKRFEGLKLSDSLYITEYGESFIVMGNVAYPAPQLDDLCSASVAAFVPIGDVNFAPSREGLKDTKATEQTILRLKAEFAKAAVGAIQREVDAAPTAFEALNTIIRWRSKVPNSDKATYSYKGAAIPKNFEYDEVPDLKPDGSPRMDHSGKPVMRRPLVESTSLTRYWNLSETHGNIAIPVTQWPNVLWVEDFTVKHTAQIKRKFQKYVADQDLNASGARVETVVLLPGKAPRSIFIDPKRIVSYADTIKPMKLDPKPRSSWQGPARIPGSYDFYSHGIAGLTDGLNDGVPGSKIDTSKPVFYIHGNIHSGRRYYDALSKMYPAFTLVCLPLNRIDKFKRDCPSVKVVYDAVKDAHAAWLKSLSEDQKIALYMDRNGLKGRFQTLDAAKVDDPALKKSIQLGKMNTSKLVETQRAFERISASELPKVQWVNPLQKYPLFEVPNGNQTHREHVYLYLNAAYAA